MPDHLPTAEHGRMSAEPAFYTIRIDGHLGVTALSAFPFLAAEQQAGQTVLVGYLDSSALYGVLAQMEMLGLDLVGLSRSDQPDSPPKPGTQWT